MEMEIVYTTGKVPVTVLSPRGAVDGSNYKDLIIKTKELQETGTRYLLLDLGNVTFLSSAGLVALHKIVLLMRGEKIGDLEPGWDALHAIDRDQPAMKEPCFKVLNPQPRVTKTLQISGMENYFEIYTDQQTAIDSFHA